MKIILSESQIKKIVDEALKDEIPSYMSDIIKKRYSNVPDVLDRDIPQHTDKIPNVKVEVDNKYMLMSIRYDLAVIFEKNILDQFTKTKLYEELGKRGELGFLIKKSLNIESIWAKSDEHGLFYGLMQLYTKNFSLPISDGSNWSTPTWSNNKSGIATFLKICKKNYPSLRDLDVESIITDKHFVGLREPITNSKKIIDNINDEIKVYLYITDKPDDKLRMSISKFYDSCQNLYSGGDAGTQYNKKLLSNVFDPNSKVAYLITDMPFTDNMGNKHPFTSIARTIIRVNENGGIMFDRVYPSKMELDFYNIIESKTGLKNEGNPGDLYHYKGVGDLPSPYMDKYKLKNTNTDLTGLNNPRIMALSEVINVDLKSLEIVADSVFKVDGEEWGVSTYDEAIEETRDYILAIFSDVFWEKSIDELISHNLFGHDAQPIFDLIGVDEEYFNEHGLEWNKHGLIEYLTEFMGIHTYEDLSKTYKRLNEAWVYGNIDFDEYIEYFGGEHEAIAFTLSRYDGNLHEVGDYYVYRMD